MNIYVGNLAYRTTEEELQSLFSEYGAVDSVKIITDRDTGRSKGFAFVEMANQAEAEEAIKNINGREIDARELRVNESKPREDRPRRNTRY